MISLAKLAETSYEIKVKRITSLLYEYTFSIGLPGTMSSTGQKGKRHVLSPADEESEPDEQDSVVALEWDPLSTEYLLLANNHSGIRLVDTDGLSTITKFQMPSAAATVHTLSWIPSAPGMFASGGKTIF